MDVKMDEGFRRRHVPNLVRLREAASRR
jgi:hypothetical protein